MSMEDPFDYQILNLTPQFFYDYPKIYQYSTLKYFHRELGLS